MNKNLKKHDKNLLVSEKKFNFASKIRAIIDRSFCVIVIFTKNQSLLIYIYFSNNSVVTMFI